MMRPSLRKIFDEAEEQGRRNRAREAKAHAFSHPPRIAAMIERNERGAGDRVKNHGLAGFAECLDYAFSSRNTISAALARLTMMRRGRFERALEGGPTRTDFSIQLMNEFSSLRREAFRRRMAEKDGTLTIPITFMGKI